MMQEYQDILIDEPTPRTHRRISLWRDRLLVLALLLSVGGCLAALWLSGILLSTPNNLLPASLLQFVTDHRLLVLLTPAVCLTLCYGLLRALTGEIMAVPERYLDERQQVVRDQAHRSAFKIIKLACVLIPLCFLLPHLPWFNQTPSSPPVPFIHPPIVAISDSHISHTISGQIFTPVRMPAQWFISSPTIPYNPTVPYNSATDLILAGGLLLLCIWLLLSALPMCVLAWKGKR